MIIVKAILINGNYSPEYIPDTHFGSHFDGINFIFFETQEEANNFYNSL